MTIEFKCPDCSKVLRTTDNKSGASANCPDCGSPITVPSKKRAMMWQFDENEIERTPSSRSRGKTCPMCGHQEERGARRCSSCGESLSSEEPPRRSHKNRRVEHAGFGLRLVAHIIDNILIRIVTFGLGFAVGIMLIAADINLNDPAMEMMVTIPLMLFQFLLIWLYYAFMESGEGQATIGKRVMGLIVSDTDGHRISFGQATGRYFAKILSLLACLIGCIWAAFDENSQAWHDKLAGTFVVKK